MRYLLAFVVFALCFCSTSPTEVDKTISGKDPFTVCVSGYEENLKALIYIYDSTTSLNIMQPHGSIIAIIKAGDCAEINLPDGTQIVSYLVNSDAPYDFVNAQKALYTVNSGDFWNL